MDAAARMEREIERFGEALSLPDDERRAFIDSLHSEDAVLADEIDSLLTSYRGAPERLDELAARVFPNVVRAISSALDRSSAL
jgi:hypothetical protein